MNDDIKTSTVSGTWVVRAGGAVIGESDRVVELSEGGHDPVIYFPREDIAMALLEPSASTSASPRKGQASYYSIVVKSGPIKDCAWSYETPKPELEAIAGHLAFYPDRVTIEEL